MIGVLERGIDMKFRALFLSIVFSLASSPTWACSCAPWEGYVSEFTEDYVSFWGVPVSAKLSDEETQFGSNVIYKFEIFEDYNRIPAHTIEISAHAPNGGNCGASFNIGQVGLVSAYKQKDGQLVASFCTPSLPYAPVQTYLKSGKDVFIPAYYKCLNDEQEFKKDDPECEVWKEHPNYQYSEEEASDRKKYLKEWRSKRGKVIR